MQFAEKQYLGTKIKSPSGDFVPLVVQRFEIALYPKTRISLEPHEPDV